LEAGTQACALKTGEEAIKYATAYANKSNQKAETKSGYVRFRGSSGSLTDPIVELEDMSIRQFQHIRSNWLSSLGVTWRLDRMNCYIWNGAEWAAGICCGYYNMHILSLQQSC
jgi:hypothetical protein